MNIRTIWNKKLAVIIILAAALRLLWLNRIPISLNWDEISMGYTAYSISETSRDEWGEKLPIFFRSYGEWKSAVYIYTLVPFIRALGLNAWGVRLPSALAGIISVYLTYLITKKIWNKKAGLWAALFLAVSPWHLMLSRPAFEANVALTLILAGIYFFLLRDTRYLILSALFFGLAPHTYNSAKVMVPLLILWLIYAARRRLTRAKIVLFFTILAVFALPLATNLVSGRSQHRYSQVGITTDINKLVEFYEFRNVSPLPEALDKLLFNKYTFFAVEFVDNYFSYFSPSYLLTEGGDHNQHNMPFRGILYVTEAILIVYALKNLKKNSSSLKYLPIALIVFGVVPAAATRDKHHVLRSILTLPGWQMLAALGATYVFTPTNTSLAKKSLLALFAFESITFLYMYFVLYPAKYARDWQYGHKEVATYVHDHGDEYERIVMTKWFGEPQLFLAFYNQWDPVWYQQENKKLLRYEAEGRIWLDQLEEYSIGKYTFEYIDFTLEKRSPETLYIGKFDDFFGDSNYMKTIYFPDGSVAFHIVGGKQ